MNKLPNITTLRHPQLLDPPSRCPNCGSKAWEQCQAQGHDPAYQCESCQWPAVKPKWTRHQLHDTALHLAISHLHGSISDSARELLAALEAERERWQTEGEL